MVGPRYVRQLSAVTTMSVQYPEKKQTSCFMASEPYDEELLSLLPKLEECSDKSSMF